MHDGSLNCLAMCLIVTSPCLYRNEIAKKHYLVVQRAYLFLFFTAVELTRGSELNIMGGGLHFSTRVTGSQDPNDEIELPIIGIIADQPVRSALSPVATISGNALHSRSEIIANKLII
jgi:hypothetical protein